MVIKTAERPKKPALCAGFFMQKIHVICPLSVGFFMGVDMTDPVGKDGWVTYSLGLSGAWLSSLSPDEWLLYLSIVLVSVRLILEMKQLYEKIIRPWVKKRGRDTQD